MKLEREPALGHITLGHKADPKSFDYNELSDDSNGLKSGNIVKETQNRHSDDFKDNEKGATQLFYLMNDEDGLAASKLNLKTHKEYQVKDIVAPFAKSSLEMESVEKGSDDYTDKGVTECEMPEFQVCYRENSYNSVKDICIDEGAPALDNILFESGADMKSLCTFVFPDQDKNIELNGHVDMGVTSPNGLKSSTKNESEKEFVNVLNLKDEMQKRKGNCNAMDKLENDKSKDKIFPENLVSTLEVERENPHPWSPSWDGDGDAAAQVQISRDKVSETTYSISPGFDLAAEKLCNGSEEAAVPVPVSEAEESKSGSSLSNDLVYESKVEKRRITFDFGSLSTVTIAKEEWPQNGISESLETENMSSVDAETTNMRFVSSHVQHDSSFLLVTRDYGQTPSMPVDEDGTSDARTSSSNTQYELPREHCPQNGVCTSVETPNSQPLNDGTSELQNVSSSLQHVTVKEESLPSLLGTDTVSCETPDASMVVNGTSGPQVISGRFQYGVGESSFSAAGPVSGRISYSGPIPYSGSISLRSDSSTTSTRSFAFPILQSEWNSSPVRMAKADQRHFRKHKGWRQGLLCCRF